MSEIKYQVKMTYDREDIAALVRTMEFRRHPEKRPRPPLFRVFYPDCL